MEITTEITNLAGTTYRLGQRVQHTDGWTGTIFKIDDRRALLFVNPDDINEVPKRDCWPLNPVAAKESGRAEFCKARDHGQSMGNFRILPEFRYFIRTDYASGEPHSRLLIVVPSENCEQFLARWRPDAGNDTLKPGQYGAWTLEINDEADHGSFLIEASPEDYKSAWAQLHG